MMTRHDVRIVGYPDGGFTRDFATADREVGYLDGGFTGDFATADGARVMITALTQQQFADLAETTRLGRTFAFLERLLPADFSSCEDLYTHRVALAALLAPWFSRRTVADLASEFAGTTVPWTRLGS